MDSEQFDNFVKSLAGGRSRRRVLQGVVAGALALLGRAGSTSARGGCGKVEDFCDAANPCCGQLLCANGTCHQEVRA
jgi:hypothetical protein